MLYKTKNNLKQFFFTNAFGILCSRILGFIRDAMQASILGTSIYSDIFFIAFKFPNMFRRVVSEGAFVQSFLPFFLSSKKKGAFSVSIFWIFVFFILILSIFVMVFTPFITKILALGYDKSRIELAIPLVRIHFWYLILIFIVTYLSTLLQYKNIFWVNAYNTVLLNIAMIVAMIPYQFKGGLIDSELFDVVYILSYSVLIGGICQILIHFYPLYTSGILKLQYIGMLSLKKWHKDSFMKIKCFGITFNQDAIEKKNDNLSTICYKKCIKAKYNILRLLIDIKVFFKAFFPAMIGASTAQIIAIIDSSLVTLLPHSDGGVSILNFANRIFQLPLAIFAIAISSALFPTIAKAIEQKNEVKAIQNLKNAFWFLLITLSVCTIGGIILKNEIVWLLFERNNFTREDTLQVALAFMGYMVGLLPFGLTRIFSLWLYSKKQQAKAAKFSVIALLIGTSLSALLILYFRYFNITSGFLWNLRYFLIAFAGSFGGIVLMFFNIREFGIHNFLDIIKYKKYSILLLVSILITFVILEFFKHFFHI